MTVGERLRRARRKLGKRQEDVAAEIGVTQPFIAQLESGDSVPSKRIRDVAKAYGVDPLDLIPRRAA